MNMKAMKQRIILTLVAVLATGVFLQAQNFQDLPLDKQRTFFEGYWKYVSENRDTVFIVKLKSIEDSCGIISYIGSCLYRNPSITENNIPMLDDYMQISTFDEYLAIYESKQVVNPLYIGRSLYITGWEWDVMDGYFYDYTKEHSNGKVDLVVRSAVPGAETISWSLYLYDLITYPEGEEDKYLTFSVPTEITLTKMYNLDEFADLGIILSPFPPPRMIRDIQE